MRIMNECAQVIFALALPWYSTDRSGGHHWGLLLLPRSQIVQNHGDFQDFSASGLTPPMQYFISSTFFRIPFLYECELVLIG